jgi:hypothetical protein
MISGPGSAIWSKMSTIILEVVPIHAYAPFQALLPFFNAPGIVFYEGVQHHLRFYLDHLSCVKLTGGEMEMSRGQVRQVEWVGDDSHVVFGKKNP